MEVIQSTEPKVSIIILNWNGKQDTSECLKSVQEIEYSNYEAVVVDNGSHDGSVEYFKNHFPEVTVVENNANLGYAEGNNRGIAYAMSKGSDYIFLLNNDAIVDPYILKNFLQVASSRPEAGVFGAKIYHHKEPKKIWFAGGAWISETAQTSHVGSNQIDDEQWNEIRPIDYACGCAILIKSEVIKKIGALEAKYFLTWEETDFCYKARRAGFECLFVPSAHVWHKVSASFNGGGMGLLYRYFIHRNRLLWIERNIPLSEKIRIYPKVILPEFISYLRVYISPKTNPKARIEHKVNLVAFRDYIFRRFGDSPAWIRTTKV
ncbi:MAG: glycosyltransferase family 2 protein [Calothrix sp. C42_A2020_038]|nr:glycosyltransferase family 2 protein [Calothrix sp. C42_A2020_038]